jgi:hypothetical protein
MFDTAVVAGMLFVIAAGRVDAQASAALSGRARLQMAWSATPQEQQSIERTFVAAEWPIVTGHGPTDRATLMVFLSRIQSSDTSAHVTAWTARVVDIESGKFLRHLSCTSHGTDEFPSNLPRRLRRDLADSTATPQARAGSIRCTDL